MLQISKNTLRRSFFVVLTVSATLIMILLYNIWRSESLQPKDQILASVPPLPQNAVRHFKEIIQHQTISYRDTLLMDSGAFKSLHRYLVKQYPLLHQKLKREVVSNYSLLYTWKGSDTTKSAVVLLAHMDVVPVESASLKLWEAAPFRGEEKNGFIWGRGAHDNKVNLVSIMEATETLLKRGFIPERTIYFAFGHDEETGNSNGARAMAERLSARGVHADLVLDEGGIITSDRVPGITRPVALLGTSEKGFLTLSLSVEKAGGHSSMPQHETAIDILSHALVRIRSNPFEPRIARSQVDFLEHIGPELPFIQRMAFANTWLFKGMIIGKYSSNATGNAMMRTTIAPTIIAAGVADNIIPTHAEVIINLRLLPGDDFDYVTSEIKNKINDDRVTVKTIHGFASAVYTSPDSFAFKVVRTTVHKVFPKTISTPFLLVGATDSRHFTKVSDNIIRFSPVVDPIGFHGVNERVSIDAFQHAIWFYEELMSAI